MKRIATIVTTLLVLVGCTTLECPLNHAVNIHFAFCNPDGTEQAPTDTMWVVAHRPYMDKDGIMINRQAGVATFALPCSYQAEEDVLYFVFNPADTETMIGDTLTIVKEDKPQFQAVDCQPTFFHELKDVRYTTNRIDSIVINHPTVNYESNKNLLIYLHPLD